LYLIFFHTTSILYKKQIFAVYKKWNNDKSCNQYSISRMALLLVVAIIIDVLFSEDIALSREFSFVKREFFGQIVIKFCEGI